MKQRQRQTTELLTLQITKVQSKHCEYTYSKSILVICGVGEVRVRNSERKQGRNNSWPRLLSNNVNVNVNVKIRNKAERSAEEALLCCYRVSKS